MKSIISILSLTLAACVSLISCAKAETDTEKAALKKKLTAIQYKVTQENAAMVGETAASSRSLKSKISEMHHLMAKFRGIEVSLDHRTDDTPRNATTTIDVETWKRSITPAAAQLKVM